ncbi:SRPBCC family protein [Streptomyces sp. 110]|uniref:SRPBCC family protein n=1 Tax=Streptomyces endocoffeicus TaxID=2898945 RepID=A0ABS1PVI6_9ACTN|nr:SRPBCC family protein [Streptomyces endocoffeicus]MBL1116448.1 SRPBCC family protein [Streptomyces endocoffeicus]
MRLQHTFHVPAHVDDAWKVLGDVPRIVPCMPGATLHDQTGDQMYSGAVQIKVGPITAEYQGTAQILDRDDDQHQMTVRAQARDVRGQGSAAATISLTARPDGAATLAEVTTDLEITGRVAQFGRGVLEQVSRHIVDEFARRLSVEITAPGRDTDSAVDAPPAGSGNLDLATLTGLSPRTLRVVYGAAAIGLAAVVLFRAARRRRR